MGGRGVRLCAGCETRAGGVCAEYGLLGLYDDRCKPSTHTVCSTVWQKDGQCMWEPHDGIVPVFIRRLQFLVESLQLLQP